MYKNITLIVILVLFLSCEKRNEPLNGFGNLKLGMSLKELDSKYKNEQIHQFKKLLVTRHVDTVDITDDIFITDVNIFFANGKAYDIVCNSNDNFYNFLMEKYGISASGKSNHLTWVKFKTSKDIECSFDSSYKGDYIGIIDIKAHKLALENNKGSR